MEREGLANRLIKGIRIIKESESKIHLEIQKMKLEKQRLELKNEALVEKNNNLKKMIKEDINKKVKYSK